MSVDTHPDQFNVINSIDEKVVENTKGIYGFMLICLMIWDILLGNGSSFGKCCRRIRIQHLKDLKNNFKRYPDEITSKLILENDDKTFTAKETLQLCKNLGIVPMVLDVHHHMCNNDGDDIVKFCLIYLTHGMVKLFHLRFIFQH